MGTVMKNSQSSSSRCFTEMSDFPMPESIGDFPMHDDVAEYLNSYAEKFDLNQHIHFEKIVESASKSADSWIVKTSDSTVYESKNLIVCSGIHQKPNLEFQENELNDFDGEVLHAGTLKKFDENHRDKRVMILGGGETASDILQEWSPHTKQVVWCIPQGQHFKRKAARPYPGSPLQAYDKASSRALNFISPVTKSQPGQGVIHNLATSLSHCLPRTWYSGIPKFRSPKEGVHQQTRTCIGSD